MIYSLNGKLLEKNRGYAVVECGGIGLMCRISTFTYASLPENGKPVFLLTVFNLREDSAELIGFFTEDERNCYNLLVSVNGVGPKAALSILSCLDPRALILAVVSEDVRSITKAQGVGPKVASRIVLELKDKISKEYDVGEVYSMNSEKPKAPAAGPEGEAMTALTFLGYTRQEAAKAVAKTDTAGKTVEQIIKDALVFFNKN